MEINSMNEILLLMRIRVQSFHAHASISSACSLLQPLIYVLGFIMSNPQVQ